MLASTEVTGHLAVYAMVISLALLWQSFCDHHAIYHLYDGERK